MTIMEIYLAWNVPPFFSYYDHVNGDSKHDGRARKERLFRHWEEGANADDET